MELDVFQNLATGFGAAVSFKISALRCSAACSAR